MSWLLGLFCAWLRCKLRLSNCSILFQNHCESSTGERIEPFSGAGARLYCIGGARIKNATPSPSNNGRFRTNRPHQERTRGGTNGNCPSPTQALRTQKPVYYSLFAEKRSVHKHQSWAMTTPWTRGKAFCVVPSVVATSASIPPSTVWAVRARCVIVVFDLGKRVWLFGKLYTQPDPLLFAPTRLQAGICCCNLECCCKFGAPCLIPCCCVGIRPEYDGCSVINAQCQACCVVASIALPCNDEVPVALTIAGCTIFPTCGCCIQQKEIMRR
jgi:hypothetical protein